MFDGTQLREQWAADEYAAPAINVPSLKRDGVPAGPSSESAAAFDGRDPSLNAEVCGKTTLHAASCGFLASVGEYDAPKSLACAGLRAIALLEDRLAVLQHSFSATSCYSRILMASHAPSLLVTLTPQPIATGLRDL